MRAGVGSTVRFNVCGCAENFCMLAGELARLGCTALESQSESPVSQGAARSGIPNGIRIAVESLPM